MNMDIDIDMDVDERAIEDEDYTLTPCGSCGSLGGRIGLAISGVKFIGEYANEDDALAEVRKRMEQEQFWPTVWWISDHGNSWPINLDGDEIK